MNIYDSEFEKLRISFENGEIKEDKLSNDQMEKLTNYYKDEIESNKKEITIMDKKIKSLKDKIDSIV